MAKRDLTVRIDAGAFDRRIRHLYNEACRERDSARATIDFILNAIEGDRFSDGLQTAEQYVRYSLGTASLLYHVEGYGEMCQERDRYRRALENIRDLEAKVCDQHLPEES